MFSTQSIKFVNDNDFWLVFNGVKIAHFLYSDYPISVGELVILSSSGPWGIIVDVKNIEDKKIEKITSSDAISCGYESLVDFLNDYKNSNMSSPKCGKLVKFDFIDPFKPPFIDSIVDE